jgi:hypothetical protein
VERAARRGWTHDAARGSVGPPRGMWQEDRGKHVLGGAGHLIVVLVFSSVATIFWTIAMRLDWDSESALALTVVGTMFAPMTILVLVGIGIARIVIAIWDAWFEPSEWSPK